MKKSGSRLGLAGMLVFWAGWIAFSGVSSATLPIQKKAKELGFDAQNCMYCHNEKLPKKGAVTHNERGKWLLAEKEKRGVKEVDPAWLKDYPGGEK
ncbi:MAG: hypothetical protein ACRD1P_02205 [Thermoanaerobaculia bacterium]